MSATTHTLAPFQLDRCGSASGGEIMDAGGKVHVASVYTHHGVDNGPLLAAAPELLAALERMLEWVVEERSHCPDDWDNSNLDQDIQQAEAAIAKAKGEA